MKDEIKEILYILKDIVIGRATRLTCREADKLLDYITNLQEENERLKNRLELYNNALNEKITEFKTKETDNLQDRIEELEAINEEHRKINGELRKTINEAIEYLEYQIPQLDFEKDIKAKMLGAMVLVLLQGSDE